MPPFRRSFNNRAVKRFKKRFLQVPQVGVATTSGLFGQIQVQETGTLVSLKLDLACWQPAFVDGMVEIFICAYVTRQSGTLQFPDATDTQTIGTAVEYPEIDSLNGFFVGSMYAWGASTTDQWLLQNKELHEKFKFKRKVSKNDLIVVSVQGIARQGAFNAPSISGTIYAVIQTT